MRIFTALGAGALMATVSSASPALAAPWMAEEVTDKVTYVDPDMEPSARELRAVYDDKIDPNENAIMRRMRETAKRFDEDWGDLPQFDLRPGPTLSYGDKGIRVRQLRERLGLTEGDIFDAETVRRVALYRVAHGLKAGREVDGEMLASLNLGHDHYARLIDMNLARLAALPSDLGDKYIFVDAAEQRLYMFADGKSEGEMKVVVGKLSDPTPMMAAEVTYATVNPYWNIPTDLVRRTYAPRVLAQGKGYFDRVGFEALSGWDEDARVLDFDEVDWQAVADGDIELRLRQKPGPGNGMGEIKFMFPNALGIYLHDTPSRQLFNETDRLFSAGCVRLEDAWRLSDWLFGDEDMKRGSEAEQNIFLDKPVPVYITYLTAVPNRVGFDFREDFYGRDRELLAAR